MKRLSVELHGQGKERKNSLEYIGQQANGFCHTDLLSCRHLIHNDHKFTLLSSSDHCLLCACPRLLQKMWQKRFNLYSSGLGTQFKVYSSRSEMPFKIICPNPSNWIFFHLLIYTYLLTYPQKKEGVDKCPTLSTLKVLTVLFFKGRI